MARGRRVVRPETTAAVEVADAPGYIATAVARISRRIDENPSGAALAVALLHLATRLPGLGRRGFWLDEAWTAALAVQAPRAILFAGLHDENPPLYNLFTAGWVRLFGISEVALRVPSVIAGGACAAALLLVVHRRFGAEASLWASLLLLVNPLEWHYSREARAYAIIQLLCIVSYGLFLRLFDRPTWVVALALGMIEAVGMATHYLLGLAFAAQALAALLACRAAPRAFRFWCGAQALALALFSPLLQSLWRNAPTKPEVWRPVPDASGFLRVASELVGSRSALGWGLALVAIAVATAAWRRSRHAAGVADAAIDGAPRGVPADAGGCGSPAGAGEAWRLATVATWVIVPLLLGFAIAQRVPIFLSRYLLFAALGWCVLAGALIARLPGPALARVAFALALALASCRGFGRLRAAGLGEGPGWREAARRVSAERAQGADEAIVSPSIACITFAYHFRPDLVGTLFGPGGYFAPGRLYRRLRREGIRCLTFEAIARQADSFPERTVLVLAWAGAFSSPALVGALEAAGFEVERLSAPPGLWISRAQRRRPPVEVAPAAGAGEAR